MFVPKKKEIRSRYNFVGDALPTPQFMDSGSMPVRTKVCSGQPRGYRNECCDSEGSQFHGMPLIRLLACDFPFERSARRSVKFTQGAMRYSNAASRSMNRSLRTCFSRIV
jgi:hypothetical protein